MVVLINIIVKSFILCTKTENKTLDNYVYQYNHAGSYLDRREAIDFASKNQDNADAVEFLKKALKDKYEGLRSFAISKLDMRKDNVKKTVEPILLDLAKNDPKRLVKAGAISKLAQYRNSEYAPIFKSAVNDSSYTVSGNALEALSIVDSAAALAEAKRLSKETVKGKLSSAITAIIIKSGDESMAEIILSGFEKMPLSQAKFEQLGSLANFLEKTRNMDLLKRGVDDIVAFRDAIPEN